jgi:membrane protein implicated in regulation of membrane protease activity
MNWELFFLVCFVVGFSFSVISFVGGLSRFHVHIHLPKHLHLGGGAHGLGGGAASAHGPARPSSGAHFSFINPMTAAAFLTWFGGTGYLLVHLRHIWIFAGLVLASLAGLLAAGIVFFFVARLLMANDQDTDPMDYEMVGVLGRISVPIRTNGTGELIFEQQGVRKPCAARSEHGKEVLAKGEEVVVTRYERGVAYVRRWDDLANQGQTLPQR